MSWLVISNTGQLFFNFEGQFRAPGRDSGESEIGIDISNRRSKSVEEFIGQWFDYVITVCDNAKESRPVLPGNAARIHQNYDDPPPPGVGDDEFRLAAFRRAPDEVRQWMEDFIKAPGK